MNDKTLETINLLSGKLGVTIEHLWGVLIRHASVSAAISALWLGLLITAVSLFTWWVRRNTTVPAKTAENPNPLPNWGRDAEISGVIYITIAWVFTTVAAFWAVSDIAIALLNPEYWALKQLLPR